MLLKDKVVIVSGVGPGMGQSLARVAAAEGAKVVLGARSKGYLEEVAADIKSKGGKAVAQPCDVSDAKQCNALAAAAVEAFGTIDGLVNSAYMHGEWNSVEAADIDEWAAVYNVNCLGALRMAQAVLPAMKKAGGGAIVNVSTQASVKPFPGEGGYATAKGGLTTLSRQMAKDFGKYNVRVNTTRMGWIGGAPVLGWIDREVASGRKREDVVGAVTADISIGVIPPEEDCAKGVLFFVSDYAKVVSGAVLDINGGHYMAP
jgi:NAD(P)-dependent dehydrogenase (short-subunit alcohol dehydrogenase family)